MNFGRYEVLGILGRGGMATVYLANDERVGRKVAVKVLSPQLLDEPGFRERFRREARVIAALEHHAIVPMYDHGEEDGQPFLVFRFMDGGTLADRLHAGPLSIAAAVPIVSSVAEALDYARDSGVIHRDLKPANILFDRHGHALLGDFGIARLIGPGATTTTSTSIGTPSYMSPEQAEGKPATPASDIYSLGCTVFEMLAGRPPFEAETLPALLLKHVREEPPTLGPGVPPVVATIVRQALSKDSGRRPARAAELAEAMAVGVVLAGNPTRIERALPPLPRPSPVPSSVPPHSQPRSQPVAQPPRFAASRRTARAQILAQFVLTTLAFLVGWAFISVALVRGELSGPEVAILWFLCVAGTALVAAARSASTSAWAGRAVLLGPVALWLIMALPVAKVDSEDSSSTSRGW